MSWCFQNTVKYSKKIMNKRILPQKKTNCIHNLVNLGDDGVSVDAIIIKNLLKAVQIYAQLYSALLK